MREKSWLKQYPNSVSKEIEIPKITMNDILQESAQKIPENEAIVFYHKRISYKELVGLAYVFSSALQSNGVQKGDRVAIMLPNCPQ